MELLSFFKYLKRYRAILVLVPLATLLIAFGISRYLPDKYTSHARFACSVADKSQQMVNDNNAPQEQGVNEEFDNLLQTLTLNKILDRVSYKLMLHDLQSAAPFRKPSKMVASLSSAQKQAAIAAFTQYYDERKSLNTLNGYDKELYKMLKSEKYDDEAIKKAVIASRMENSEYINLEYSSENPQLSAFVVNNLSNEFIGYYTSVYSANKNRSVAYLDSLLQVKQKVLATQMEQMKQYKIDNGILNVDDEAKTIYGQIADMEAKKENAEKDMVAYGSALKNIDSRFSPNNRKYLEGSLSGINSDIVSTKDQLKAVNDAYIQSGFKDTYKAKMDSLQKKLTRQIYDQTDNVSYNPNAAKDNLVAQKLNLEISRDLAQNSVQSLNSEISKLNNSLQKLVPNLATIQSYQSKIEVANKEYQDVLQKYNQASLDASYSLPVRLVEKATPGDPAPSKKILLVAFSGIASLVLTLVVFFILFYFDNTIRTTEQLQSSLDIPVIGSLNCVNGEYLNFQDLWSDKTTDSNSMVFKNSLRLIRHEMESDMQDGSVMAVTSLNEGEGKTFFALSLAYAFSRVGKRVLLIDGNFMHPDISNTIKAPIFIEKFLNDKGGTYTVVNDSISIIGNKGGDNSLLELSSSKNIHEFFDALKTIFNVIIVETSAMESINKANAKEWISFADKVAVVFESGRAVEKANSTHIQYLKQLGNKLAGMVLNKVAVVPMPSPANFNMLLEAPKTQTAYGG